MKLLNMTVFTLCFVLSVNASSTYRSGNIYRVAQTDTIANDLFCSARYLDIDGEVKGDVYAGAQQINIQGKIKDDLWVWSEITNINGEIGDGIVGFSKDININGKVYGDIRAGCAALRIQEGSEIFGDIYVWCGSLFIEKAVIHGKILGGCGEAYLNGRFNSDIELKPEKIEFGESFHSEGAVLLHLSEEAKESLKNIPENVQIEIEDVEHFYCGFFFYWFFVAALIIGILIIALFKGFYLDLISIGKKKWLTNTGIGFVFIIIVPVLVVLALLVLPLAFFIGAFYLTLIYLSKIFTAFIIGNLLQKKILGGSQIYLYIGYALGILLLTLLFQIPWIGIVIKILTLFFGSGTFLYYLWNLRGKKA
jgi:cytoskeletal protein CcmA (bactofilin family)